MRSRLSVAGASLDVGRHSLSMMLPKARGAAGLLLFAMCRPSVADQAHRRESVMHVDLCAPSDDRKG